MRSILSQKGGIIAWQIENLIRMNVQIASFMRFLYFKYIFCCLNVQIASFMRFLVDTKFLVCQNTCSKIDKWIFIKILQEKTHKGLNLHI